MNAQSQGTASSSLADLPLKRKRGRPRKDESLVQVENIQAVPGCDSMRKCNQSLGTVSSIGGEMVGQAVSGVIEGSFDAGYLLKVKVGNSDTHLRGVVFLPGRFIPITASNDLAPEAKMFNRTEIPIPVSTLPIQQSGPFPLPEQIDKQLLELKNPSPDQRQPSELPSSVTAAKESQSASAMLPCTDKLPISITGPSLGEKTIPQPILESGTESRSASHMVQVGNDKVAKEDKVLQESHVPVKNDPNAMINATEQVKLLPQFAPPNGVFPDTGILNLELQIRNHDASNESRLNHSVQGVVKSATIEQNCAPAISEPGILSSESIGINMWMEKQASPGRAAITEIPVKNSSGNDASHLNGNPVSHAAEVGLQFAPMNGLPATLFEREAIPSSPRVVAEESSLQNMITPQFGSSSATNTMKAGSDSTPMTTLPVTLFEREDISSESKIAAD